jgi:hypothetical protein
MQKPTLKNVKIRSTRDALLVFYGVARNVLPLITRRLDAEERRAIVPGNVYVWEERGANTESTGIGMERWTDGMGWGPSRVRDVCNLSHSLTHTIVIAYVHLIPKGILVLPPERIRTRRRCKFCIHPLGSDDQVGTVLILFRLIVPQHALLREPFSFPFQ